MENFRTYTGHRNQGATNAGENVRYIHTWAVVTINAELAQARPNYDYYIINEDTINDSYLN